MSNDISPSAQRLPPAAAAATGAPRPTEAIRPQPPVQNPQSVAMAKQDAQETQIALKEATENLNKQMARNKRDLSFSVDDASNKVVVTVKNLEGEVVRQIPSEVALRVANNLENMKGLFKDEKS